VAEALSGFVGTVEQVPPAHSAVHVGGRRAYKLARAGRRPDLPPRRVTMYELKLLRYAPPELEIDVRCSSGTYIRALARDFGQRLGCGGYCSALMRTEVGAFHVADALPPDELHLERNLLDPLCALEGVQRVALNAGAAGRIANGNRVSLPEPAEPGEAAVLDADAHLLAIGEVDADGVTLRPRRVFPRG
jgi:tRNA pseudouridine55 synthase